MPGSEVVKAARLWYSCQAEHDSTLYGTSFRLARRIISTEMKKQRKDLLHSADHAEHRSARADAQRNAKALLEAAMKVFAKSGVDAPMRDIAAQAGVGVGTLYRHFPQRSDIIKAIIKREVDACVEYAASVTKTHAPDEALALWVQQLVDLAATKRGLGPALHSGDAAYQTLPDYVLGQLTPALRGLIEAAVAKKKIRAGIDAREFLLAALRLAAPASDGNVAEARRMVALLVDGLRFRAGGRA